MKHRRPHLCIALCFFAACAGSTRRPAEPQFVPSASPDAATSDANDAAAPDDAASTAAAGPDAASSSEATAEEETDTSPRCPNGEASAERPPPEIESPAREAFARLMDRVRAGGEAAADRSVDRAFAPRFFRAHSLYSPDEAAIRGAPAPLRGATGFGRALQRIAGHCTPRWTTMEGRMEIQPALDGAPRANIRELEAVNRRVQTSRGATAYCGGCPMLEVRYALNRAGEVTILGWGELDTPPSVPPNH